MRISFMFGFVRIHPVGMNSRTCSQLLVQSLSKHHKLSSEGQDPSASDPQNISHGHRNLNATSTSCPTELWSSFKESCQSLCLMIAS